MSSASIEGHENPGFDIDKDDSLVLAPEPRRRVEFQTQESEYHFTPKKEVLKGWDAFIQSEDESKSASDKNTGLIKKASIVLKILTIIVVFGVVLIGALVSKGSLMFMLAQASYRQSTVVTCTYNITNDNGTIQSDPENNVAWLCIFFSFLGPELLTFLKCVRVCIMRTVARPKWDAFLIVFLMETLHVIGLAFLFFAALPGLDSIKALMLTSCIAFIPGLLMLLNWNIWAKSWQRYVIITLNALSFLLQASGLIAWPVANIEWAGKPMEISNSWALAVGILLTSFGWWESFVTQESSFIVAKFLWGIKTDMFELHTRFFTYLFTSVWKIFLFFILFIVFPVTFGNIPNSGFLFDHFHSSFATSNFTVDTGDEISSELVSYHFPVKVLATQLFCGYATYVFGKFACKVNIQRIAFALPLTLVMPVSITTLCLMCKARNDDHCAFSNDWGAFSFFQCPENATGNQFVQELGWIWILWALSNMWIVNHIWFPKSQRLASTEQMFGVPWYCGLLVDQSLMANRRSDKGRARMRLDAKGQKVNHAVSYDGHPDDEEKQKKRRAFALPSREVVAQLNPEDQITRIKGCATMWHESPEEICEMLKSIFRIDEDYSARQMVKQLELKDPDYYEWETHIFFDDCMEPTDDRKHSQVNQFVRLLLDQVDIQGKKWYGTRNLKVPPPAKYTTPYGGRLEWVLPGQTKIICHLKDKNKIRHKKRWSQCMYMYYFLGFQLMDNPKLTAAQKDCRAMNTYLLALDGDVDFQPDAIIKLVDLMKRNPDVGASCGRIHPTGSGYMQWYQMFEYAIGHWLQKATEHVMGCVLCSPGCFSLFRGKAVMAENVMRTYTTVATEPKHFVQYDQGEDRWLCTLLLQQGWRVEYSAASDSFTACPEGFKEFYNQRRRWMPSTLANIIDLLGDWRRVIRNNDDISIFYIIYQVMMMIGTILGPGSIFLMLVGACGAAFGLSNWASFGINLAPMVIFILACLLTKSDTQIIVAQVLSIAYALVMMAVLVGLLLEIKESGWLAPTTLSFIFVAGVFILAAFLHPQEFWCLPMGLIYYITIPSMYLFLVIYSFFNLNVVSWGTREVVQKLSAEEMEEAKKKAEEQAKKPPAKKSGFMSFFQRDRLLEFSLTKMFTDKNGVKSQLENMQEKLEKIEMALEREGYPLPEKPEEEAEIEKETTTIRKPIVRIMEPPLVFSFLMINSIWVLTVFLLQQNKEQLFIQWPFGDDLQLEPLGLLFVIFFAFVLFVQLVGMLLHRIMTLGHIVSSTKIKVSIKSMLGKKETQFDGDKFLQRNAVEMFKNLQSTYMPESDSQNKNLESVLEMAMDQVAQGHDDSVRRASNMSQGKANLLRRAETIKALKRRQTTRRQSMKPTMRPQRHESSRPDSSSSDSHEEI
ncbi:hypothetical protein TCAL_11841 [Tigriopus californicus]|uniref:chitin synthase n=1 Tax=Tigriopus californicus TaxID=6832 RepID=A0A553NES3_TIGCA|nr:hypothetical protein TCAL_11841 [Tigriopus californicus]